MRSTIGVQSAINPVCQLVVLAGLLKVVEKSLYPGSCMTSPGRMESQIAHQTSDNMNRIVSPPDHQTLALQPLAASSTSLYVHQT